MRLLMQLKLRLVNDFITPIDFWLMNDGGSTGAKWRNVKYLKNLHIFLLGWGIYCHIVIWSAMNCPFGKKKFN